MMLLANYVRPAKRNLCLRDKALIERAGILSYCVVPADKVCDEDVELVAYYTRASFEQRSYSTELLLPVKGGATVLRSGLTDITFMLSLLSDQPEWLERLRRGDAQSDDATVLRTFGINPDESCRPSVKGWSAGEFLAPDEDGYAYFLVEPYGETSIISRSERLLPVAFHYAAHRVAEAVRLAERLGKISPAADKLTA